MQQIDFLTFTQLAQSGGGSPSNWSSYPATNNVVMSNYTLVNGILSNTANLSGSPYVFYQGNITQSNAKPLLYGIQTDGGGSNQPNAFDFWRGTYIKNDPMGNPSELFTLNCGFDLANGWTITSYWEGYIANPLTIGGTPLTFSVGGNEFQQIYITSVNGGTGRLWVDSNGALYWNSNLIANA